ncbi:nidogen-like domain-containing protein [Tabrizicola sp.]|uniref:nidogen-like domain-containing protein n=1 Tax=Tabrizicola sp. TaxID=2005166 RepID=UPI003D29D074
MADARVVYSVELVDGETGIPTRVSARVIEIGGGNGIIDGGDGTDTLLLTKTSPYLNSFANNLATADDRLVRMEKILLAPEPVMAASVTVSTGQITQISFAGVSAAGVPDGTYELTITNEQVTNQQTGESTPIGTGAVATATVVNGAITAVNITNAGTGYTADTTVALNSVGIDLILTGQTENIEVYGSTAADSVVGGSGNDQLFGVGGNDTLIGGGGDDTIDGGAGADSVDGGLGNDVLIYASQAALIEDVTVIGGDGTDTIRMDSTTSALTLVSSDFAKVTQVEILALNGTGAQGVTLGAATNTAFATGITITTLAAASNLNLQGALSTVTVHATGTDNADTLIGGSANDTLVGGNGNDTLTGGAGIDSLLGGNGNDVFRFGNSEFIAGETVDGGDDTDTIILTADTQTIADAAFANKSNLEAITTANGTNSLTMGATATNAFSAVTVTVTGGDGADTITLTGFGRSASVVTANGDDVIVGTAQADTIIAGDGADTITGGAGSDSLLGGNGNDVFRFGDGEFIAGDTVNGGDGTDTVILIVDSQTVADADFANKSNLEAITTANGTNSLTIGATATNAFSAVTVTVTGGTGADTITLTGFGRSASVVTADGNDVIVGTAQADTIISGKGSDTITGAGGADSIDAGDDDDVVIFASSANLAAVSTVIGGLGTDALRLSAGVTLVDSDFGKVTQFERLELTGANTVTLGSNANSAGLSTVKVGSGTTSISQTHASALTIDAQDLGNDTTLTINDDGVTSNFTVTNLIGNLDALSVQGTLIVDLNDNQSDDTISLFIGIGDTTVSGGAAGDTVVLNMTDDAQPADGTIQIVDLSDNQSNFSVNLGGGRQTVKLGVGVHTIDTGAGDTTGFDRIEFTVTGSATAAIDTSGTDAQVAARITSIENYNNDVIDFQGTDALGANISIRGFTTGANGFVTNFGTVATTLGEKIAAVRAALDTDTNLANNPVVGFVHNGDTYAYGRGTGAANDDQIVRIVGDDALNTINVGSSFVLSVAPPSGAVTTSTSLIPSAEAIYTPGITSGSPVSFTPGNDGISSTGSGDRVNGSTNFLIRDPSNSGSFGTKINPTARDDASYAISVPTSLWANGLDMFGTDYTVLHMGTNGYVTFGTGFSGYSPSGLDTFTRSPMIAAQYDDLYAGTPFRNVSGAAGSGNSLATGQMYFWQDATRMVFTWDNVGLYANGISNSGGSSANDAGSAFQIILHKPGTDSAADKNFGIEIRYEEITQQNSGATAGWTAGDLTNFGLINPSKNNLWQTALGGSNVGINGVWAWEVFGGKVSTKTFLPDVVNAARDVQSVSVRGLLADSYVLGGEAASQFTVSSSGTNQAVVRTIDGAAFNLWKDAYVDRVATLTVTPKEGTAFGETETINIDLIQNLTGDPVPGDQDGATRAAGSNTILVAAGGSLITSSDGDLGQTVVVGNVTWPAITTITATGSGSTINISNQSEDYTLNGNVGVDNITGGSGDDTITGGAGADVLVGGGGDDVFIIAEAAHHASGEVITGGIHSAGDQIRFTSTSGSLLTLQATVSEIEEVRISDATGATSGTSNESVDASSASDVIRLIGNDGNNRLVGNALDNILTGNGGSDTMEGGSGSDRYVFTASVSTNETIIENTNEGSADTLYLDGVGVNMSALKINSGAAGGSLNGTGAAEEGIEIVIIKAGETATFAANQLAGTSVTINESANTANTTLNITGATGTQSFASLVFTQAGGGDAFDDGGDRVVINIAGSGTNVITGTSIGDVFIAGAQSGSLSINGGNGTDEFRATADLTLSGWTSVENLTLLGDGTDVTVAASLLPSSGLSSVTGNTTGGSVEYLKVIGSASGATVDLSLVTFTNAAASIDGADGNDVLIGGNGNDYIDGGAGDNTLQGGTGIDTLVGGEGIDTFVFNPGDTATSPNPPVTPSISSMDQVLNFTVDDRLDLSGFASVSGLTATLASGSDGDDYVISWNDGTLTHYVYAADTTIVGGLTLTTTSGVVTATPTDTASNTGAPLFDVFTVGDSGITVSGSTPYRAYLHTVDVTPNKNTKETDTGIYTVSKNLGASASFTFNTTLIDTSSGVKTAKMTLVNTSDGLVTTHPSVVHVGTASGDTVTGTIGVDIIYGFGGNDVIDGGEGNDTIFGGLGDDTIIGGVGADRLVGGAGSDTFVYADSANLANDTVDGGTGDTDVIRLNAAGTYNFTSATVSNIEQVAVNANAAMTITLSDNFNGDNANVEIVNTTGNAVTQDLTIDASAFTGGTGAINVSATNFDGNDSIVGGVGNDTINGGGGNDTIVGGAGSDSLIGGQGDDVITGGLGRDFIYGGGGFNTYKYNTVTESNIVAGSNPAAGFDYVEINSGDVFDFHVNVDAVTQHEIYFASQPVASGNDLLVQINDLIDNNGITAPFSAGSVNAAFISIGNNDLGRFLIVDADADGEVTSSDYIIELAELEFDEYQLSLIDGNVAILISPPS